LNDHFTLLDLPSAFRDCTVHVYLRLPLSCAFSSSDMVSVQSLEMASHVGTAETTRLTILLPFLLSLTTTLYSVTSSTICHSRMPTSDGALIIAPSAGDESTGGAGNCVVNVCL